MPLDLRLDDYVSRERQYKEQLAIERTVKENLRDERDEMTEEIQKLADDLWASERDNERLRERAIESLSLQEQFDSSFNHACDLLQYCRIELNCWLDFYERHHFPGINISVKNSRLLRIYVPENEDVYTASQQLRFVNGEPLSAELTSDNYRHQVLTTTGLLLGESLVQRAIDKHIFFPEFLTLHYAKINGFRNFSAPCLFSELNLYAEGSTDFMKAMTKLLSDLPSLPYGSERTRQWLIEHPVFARMNGQRLDRKRIVEEMLCELDPTPLAKRHNAGWTTPFVYLPSTICNYVSLNDFDALKPLYQDPDILYELGLGDADGEDEVDTESVFHI